MLKLSKVFALCLLSFLFSQSAVAVERVQSALDGSTLSVWWSVPFIGLLATLAIVPVISSKFWHAHYGKVSLMWALALAIPMAFVLGPFDTWKEIGSEIIGHYAPFVILIAALFTISGGLRIQMNTHGTPRVNTLILAVGTVLAGWIGTTGASMLLIRPLLQINSERTSIAHIVIFFIFLVSNIGGSATPLGDPPLFLGFLNGVDFFWTLKYLIPETFFMAIPLLILFYVIDCLKIAKEPGVQGPPGEKLNIVLTGKRNFMMLGGVILAVLMSGVWNPEVRFNFLDVLVDLQDWLRDATLLVLMFLSWKITPKEVHHANEFSWEPLLEVAKVFFAIFVTVVPVVAILHAGEDGAFSDLIALVSHNGQPVNSMYFWLTGTLSAFLDNAPTYLVFFHMAGGDPEVLMTTLSRTLEAISLGAVFMGAMTYIGNAPNFMVKAIAEHRGVRMPSFFGYMVWSVGILVPLFIILVMWRF